MTDKVDFEVKDKSVEFSFVSLVPSREPACPASALEKPSWMSGLGVWMGQV